MSLTRWIIFASFTGGIMALALQPSGIANATQTSAFLVTDQSSGSSQDALRDSRSGKKGMSDAESSGKMQSDKNAQLGGERMDKNSKIFDKSREQGGGTSQGSSEKDPNYGSGGASAPPSSSNPGMGGVGTGAGSR